MGNAKVNRFFFFAGTGLASETDQQKKLSEVSCSSAGGHCDDRYDGADGDNLFVTGGELAGSHSHCDPTHGQREGAGVFSLHNSVDEASETVGAASSSLFGCSENIGMFRVPEPVDKVGDAGDLLRGRRRRCLRKSPTTSSGKVSSSYYIVRRQARRQDCVSSFEQEFPFVRPRLIAPILR